MLAFQLIPGEETEARFLGYSTIGVATRGQYQQILLVFAHYDLVWSICSSLKYHKVVLKLWKMSSSVEEKISTT